MKTQMQTSHNHPVSSSRSLATRSIRLSALAMAIGLFTSVSAQDRDRGESITGSKILNPMTIVFNTAPIRLGADLAISQGAILTAESEPSPQPASITFVLDPDLENAVDIFSHHPGFATDDVVTSIRSLGAVRDYLNAADVSYETINLVAHGSPQTGLDVAISEGGASSSVAQLKTDPGVSLVDAAITADTQIRLYSCGVAADQNLLDAMARFFRDVNGEKPEVSALHEFIEFRVAPNREVALRESLTSVGRSRMAARKALEIKSRAQSVSLSSGWERSFHTRPLRIELVEPTPGDDAAGAAAQSPLIVAELKRLRAAVGDFNWKYTDGLLVGEAVVGFLSTEPTEQRVVLDHADAADWIASVQ